MIESQVDRTLGPVGPVELCNVSIVLDNVSLSMRTPLDLELVIQKLALRA